VKFVVIFFAIFMIFSCTQQQKERASDSYKASGTAVINLGTQNIPVSSNVTVAFGKYLDSENYDDTTIILTPKNKPSNKIYLYFRRTTSGVNSYVEGGEYIDAFFEYQPDKESLYKSKNIIVKITEYSSTSTGALLEGSFSGISENNKDDNEYEINGNFSLKVKNKIDMN